MPNSDVTPNGLAKACCIKQNDVIIGGGAIILRPKSDLVNGEYLARYIRSLERKVLKLVTGTTVFHLYSSSLKNLKLFLPSVQEQHQIASCLSSLDDLITAQEGKLDALREHKKGLMQQLFPSLENQ